MNNIIKLLTKYLINIILLINIMFLSNCHRLPADINDIKENNVKIKNILLCLKQTIKSMLHDSNLLLNQDKILVNEIKNDTNYTINTKYYTRFIAQIIKNQYQDIYSKNILNIDTLKKNLN